MTDCLVSDRLRARSPLAAVVLLVLALTGCGNSDADYRPLAIGKEGTITVVIDSTKWRGPVGDALRNTIGAYVGTLPAPEPLFDLRPVTLASPAQLEELRQQKNVVFVAVLADSTNESTYLRNVFAAEAQEAIRNGQAAVVARQNLWRRGQQVYYVAGQTDEQTAEAILAHGPAMRRTFNEITRVRTQAEMFSRGRQTHIEDTLMARHGFAVNVQHDYRIATDTTGFVWLRRLLSDTWRGLFVHYIENANPDVLTPEWIYATRDSLTKQYMLGNVRGWVEIDRRRPLETENIGFLGRFGYETRGLWHMAERDENGDLILEAGGGGPFLTYTFYDEPSRRIYMIDGMVFAPGFDKREFLRQLEVIAHTFRTRHEVANGPSVARR